MTPGGLIAALAISQGVVNANLNSLDFQSWWILPAMVVSRRRYRPSGAGYDLGGDAHRGLLGGTGAQIETDGGREPLQLLLGEPGLAEPVESVVVGEHADHGALVDPPGVELAPQVARCSQSTTTSSARESASRWRRPDGRRRRSRQWRYGAGGFLADARVEDQTRRVGCGLR